MIINLIKNLSLKYKLFVSYSVVIILTMTVGILSNYYFVRKTIEKNIESELQNATTNLLNTVGTATSVSIKNYLRAAAETNREIARYFYGNYKKGLIDEDKAKEMTKAIMLNQSIGSSGYVYCLNSNGIVAVHPEKEVMNTDVSQFDFAKQQKKRKQGYFEYDWRNPEETKPRQKAVYWTYFGPWDWIISASSYRSEFVELVNVENFRDNVLSLKFGETGYSYITDNKGNTIIHPKWEGINIYEQQNTPNEFFSEMIEKKRGRISYKWKNPGEKKFREKLVLFDYIPEYEWIVASSSYLEEFYAPMKNIRNNILFTVLISLTLSIAITIRLSSFITEPLKQLIDRFASGAAGNFSARIKNENNTGDEIGGLIYYFNTFMDKLETYNNKLNKEIRDRINTEKALRISEIKYRTFMEAVPDPVIVYDLKSRVNYLNPSFTKVLGWEKEDCFGKVTDFFIPRRSKRETEDIIEKIKSGIPIYGVESLRYKKNGKIIYVNVSGAPFQTTDGRFSGYVMILRDVTEARRLEKEIIKIGDKERQNIGQDLHDDLCPHLIGIESLCQALENKLTNNQSEVAKKLSIINGFISQAIKKTRRLSRGLCPVHLSANGLETSLNEMTINMAKMTNLNINFECLNFIDIKDNIVATHLYQIVQESINNSIKHSKCQFINILLKKEKDELIVEIADDGSGFSIEKEMSGMGLRIMRFRASTIGAKIDVDSEYACGTRIRVNLPLQ